MYRVYRAGVIRLSDNKYIDNINHTEWAEYNDWLNQGNLPQAEDIVPKPEITIEELKDRKVEKLKLIATSLRGKLNAGIDGIEMGWMAIRLDEAKNFSTANPSATPLITAIAQASGLTNIQVRNRINKFFNDRIEIEGRIEGTYIKHLIALKNLNTKQEVRDYNIKAFWPIVHLERPGNRQ